MPQDHDEHTAYRDGFRYGVNHPEEAFADAESLGLFPEDFLLRDAWNEGRQDEMSARRLGFYTKAMADSETEGPCLITPSLTILKLCDERDLAIKERDAARDELKKLQEALTKKNLGKDT